MWWYINVLTCKFGPCCLQDGTQSSALDRISKQAQCASVHCSGREEVGRWVIVTSAEWDGHNDDDTEEMCKGDPLEYVGLWTEAKRKIDGKEWESKEGTLYVCNCKLLV